MPPAIVSARVHEDAAWAFKARAAKRGLSVNQAMKLLLLKDIGEGPPLGVESSPERLKKWLRGK